MKKRLVWAFVIFVVVMFFLSVAVAQNPEKISMDVYSPHLAVGNMGNGTWWVTYLTFFNRSKDYQNISWVFSNPQGEGIVLEVEFTDGMKGFSNSILPGRPPVAPGGIERVALFPCVQRDKVPSIFNCQGDDRLQTGFMFFRGFAHWDSILNRYEPDLQVQVTFQALQNNIPFSSLSFFATQWRPGGLKPVIEVSSSDKSSVGIAVAIVSGEKANIDLNLRGPRGEMLSQKNLTITRGFYGASVARMFDELFPKFAGKLPLGTLEVNFATPGADGRGLVMGIRVDYAQNGEVRLANLMTFFKDWLQ